MVGHNLLSVIKPAYTHQQDVTKRADAPTESEMKNPQTRACYVVNLRPNLRRDEIVSSLHIFIHGSTHGTLLHHPEAAPHNLPIRFAVTSRQRMGVNSLSSRRHRWSYAFNLSWSASCRRCYAHKGQSGRLLRAFQWWAAVPVRTQDAKVSQTTMHQQCMPLEQTYMTTLRRV